MSKFSDRIMRDEWEPHHREVCIKAGDAAMKKFRIRSKKFGVILSDQLKYTMAMAFFGGLALRSCGLFVPHEGGRIILAPPRLSTVARLLDKKNRSTLCEQELSLEDEIVFVVGHEMTHLYQKLRGKLPKDHRCSDLEKYFEQPHEREAFLGGLFLLEDVYSDKWSSWVQLIMKKECGSLELMPRS